MEDAAAAQSNEARAAAGGAVPALASARVGNKLYMPTPLLAAKLPVGFSVGRVPRLMEVEGELYPIFTHFNHLWTPHRRFNFPLSQVRGLHR